MKEGTLPEKYLGVPLVIGRVTKTTLTPLSDCFKNKLTNWRGSMITLQGRAILIRDIPTVVPVYNMSVCEWPNGVVKDLQRSIKNFFKDIQKSSGVMGFSYQTLHGRRYSPKEIKRRQRFHAYETSVGLPQC